MDQTIDEAELTSLIQQGLSQRTIAERLNISHAALRRHLKKREGTPIETMGVPSTEPHGVPEVHHEVPLTTASAQSSEDIHEIIAWWRERKHSLALALDTTRKRRRQTYHVEERFIEAIRQAADLERTDLAEIVNRAFAQYFAERERTT